MSFQKCRLTKHYCYKPQLCLLDMIIAESYAATQVTTPDA